MSLSVVIITKDAEEKIEKALQSIKELASEIIVVDGGSSDKTIEIARKYGARIVRQKGKTYSAWRNQGLREATGGWILYLDYDERVTPELAEEINRILNRELRIEYSAFAIPRRNIILGREMRHGGWWPDYVKRLFKKDALKGWVGELHEEPQFRGPLGHLKNPLIHHKHDNLSEMIEKTNEWSEIEARLLFEQGHPPMSWWRFIRIMSTELWDRLIAKGGFLDGTAGVIYAIYQMWSRFITYGKLWEMQNARSNL